ncbi:MAG: helix-turn-helix domain-containing protein [Flavobacteriales bacterium]|nr:helix-turn-helix domain-containing protein [Flavobacteriales bacterium]
MDPLFRMFRVDAAEAERIATAPDEPHQHDFEELIIGVEGQLEHFIDFRTTTIAAPFVSFVTKGKVHRVRPQLNDGKCDMRVLRFRSEFIPETTFQLYAFFHANADIALPDAFCFKRLLTVCELIDGEMGRPEPDLAVVRQLLGALFTLIRSEHRRQHPEADAPDTTQNETFRNFLRILEENFRQPHDVEFYASQLFMSPRNLNLITQHILQQSVSRIIETRKLIEAKNLLVATDKPVSEIGFELGYNEKAYFTRVFKKNTGQTPTEFREEMRRLVA